ncbi:MAG: HAD-IC family P-type ATPase [Lachnospiraceae bacterium]|nr:HAD-IC family P-type ATPase [Lachnospiraceae bacterium]
MSLTDKETHQKDEVLFSGSMRHRKLPRARRRKKRVPEITPRPVGMIDPMTGEITVPDEADNLPKTDVSVPDEVIHPAAENVSVREGFTHPITDDDSVREDTIASADDDMIIPDDLQDYGSSDDLLWTDLDDAGTDEDNESVDEIEASDFSEDRDIAHAEEFRTAAKVEGNRIVEKADESREAANSDKDMFLADIEDEDAGSEDEDEPDDEDPDSEGYSGGFSLSGLFKRKRNDKKEKKKSQSRRKKAASKGKKSSSNEGTVVRDEDSDLTDNESEDPDYDDLADDMSEDPDYDDLADDASEDPDYDGDLADDESDAADSESEEPEVVHNPVIRYDPDLTYGLTSEEVSDREAEGLINVTVRKGQKTVRQIVLSHTLTYFNLLNILLGILVATTGQWKNMLFLGIIIGNSAIGIFQELKVKSLIDNLTVITAARVIAIRDGVEEEMPIDNIVVDDVIKLGPGDQIVTDGRVFDCRGLEVNESMLTGESQAVKKKDGDQVLSGSFIIAGTALQRVDKVGNESYASQLVAKASHKKRASSEMQRTIGRIIKVVSVIIIPVGLLLYRSQMIANGGVFANAIIRTVSGIIGMIPEGLVLLTSVSFIIGVGRLANKKALVQEMPSIESLARANIICTDKTGTITTGELRVNEVLPMGRVTRDQVMDIMAHINSAFTDTNVTQDALNAAFGKTKGWDARGIIPFSSERKFRAVSFDGHGDYVLGAPEFIVPNNKAALDVVDNYSQQGYRVLLLGRSKGIDHETGDKGAVAPIAAIIISDVIKEDAKETFAYFAKSGVAIKVLSGDNPLTVSSVAKKAGIAGAEKYVDATKLPEDPTAFQQAVMKYSVFGRVKPEQKQAFIKAWQAAGMTVAMVGDDVNDVLAIKDADCGIAMASGSEAAKQAAHIVLMDSDFSSMKDIVKEGKTIIANIERVSSLYLTKTIYSCLLSVIFILLKTPYPFTTLQMGLINLCGIGMPSFLLTLEQQEDVTTSGFLKHVLQTALPAALTMVTSMLVVQILNAMFPWTTDIFSTFNLMLGGLVSMLVVASVCWPLAPYRKFVLAVSSVVFLGAVILLPNFYDMHSIFMWWSLLLLPLSVLVAIMISVYSMLTQKAILKFGRMKQEMDARRKRYDPDIY